MGFLLIRERERETSVKTVNLELIIVYIHNIAVDKSRMDRMGMMRMVSTIVRLEIINER